MKYNTCSEIYDILAYLIFADLIFRKKIIIIYMDVSVIICMRIL